MIPESALATFKSKPLTPDKRRNLGHLDFLLSWLSLQMGNTAFIQSKLINTPHVSEILDNASAGIFAVSMVALYFAFYNLIKSNKERRNKRLL
ncbi:MAG: hypothetical protein NUV87_00685 [Candidatus Roizmanbacteria bacterium]|nr:hypothetical protein [Candidatus Roizmanbacteria bacterium]